MSVQLVPGQNSPVPNESLKAVIKSARPADFSAFCLHSGGKTKEDSDFVFYGQRRNGNGSVTLEGSETQAVFVINLPRVSPQIMKIALAATSDYPKITDVFPLSVRIEDSQGAELLVCPPQSGSRDEAALVLGEFYRRDSGWKFRFVDQGFNGGLRPLAEFYGVEISDDPKPQPAPEPKVNLSKVVLTKEKPQIDLSKRAIKGDIGINLNWSQKQEMPGGFLDRLKDKWNSTTLNDIKRNPGGVLSGLTGSGSQIDLDLGAFVRMANGNKFVVQALGNSFGSLDKPPYVMLLGDDRTGAQADGEWLKVNGSRLDEIREILVYAFIYEGVPNWRQTDGVVIIHIPGQPLVETHLTEGNDSLGMCAIALLRSAGGNLSIDRQDRYFSGHREMDKYYGWGFNWVRGSK